MEATQASDPVVAAAAQTDGYWYQDGINEISSGVGMLSGSAVAYMIHRQMASTGDHWGAITVGFVGITIGLTEGRVKKMLRERYSYPRIGYLSELRGEPLSRRRKVLAGAVLIVLLLLPIVGILLLKDHTRPVASLFGFMRWFPLIMGPGMLVAEIIDYKRFRLPRLLVAGTLISIAGIASSAVIDAAFLPNAVFWLATAIIKVISGSSALIALVRTVPVATE